MRGFLICSLAEEFLREFQGVELSGTRFPILLGPDKALEDFVQTDVAFAQRSLGHDVSLIGRMHRAFLLASSERSYVVLNDDWLYFFPYANLADLFDDILGVSCRSNAVWLTDAQRPLGFRSDQSRNARGSSPA